MAERRLIANADDFGRHPAVSDGILHAHQLGIVTSTTVMINFPGAAEAIRRARVEFPRLGVGVHLCLTAGPPVLPAGQVPTLIGRDGHFPHIADQAGRLDALNLAELQAELRAQIEATLAAGVRVDHLDSHHHVTFLHPTLLDAMLALAAEYDLPVRNPIPPGGFRAQAQAGLAPPGITPQAAAALEKMVTGRLLTSGVARPDAFLSTFFDAGATLENLLHILDNLPAGVNELMCHPGYSRPDLTSNYNLQRERELEILCHPAVRERLALQAIELVTFGALGT